MNTVKCETCNAVFTEMQLRELWYSFGDVAIDDKDCIMAPFMDFEAGTYRFDIWRWFDENYSGGVHQLMEDCLL